MDENQEFMELCKQLPKRKWQVWDRRIAQCFVDEPGKYADEHVDTITPSSIFHDTPPSDYLMNSPYIWLPTLNHLLDMVEERWSHRDWVLRRQYGISNDGEKVNSYYLIINEAGEWDQCQQILHNLEFDSAPTREIAVLKAILTEEREG